MNSDQYTEIEKKVLRTVLEKPNFARWASLCSLMSDGVYAAAEAHDRDLPKRGWLHICARYLAIVPKRENRDKRLAPNEFYSKETSPYCDMFRPVVRSLRHYLETIYPNFDSRTGKWSRAGKEDKVENPFPFFIDYYLNPGDDEDDDVVTFSTLFEPIPEDCGDILRWTPEFNERLELMTDDYDAELEFGDFAGNVDENGIKEIVKYIDEPEEEVVSAEELDRVARIMVHSYETTQEMHQSILRNRGVGRFACDDFDRSALFHLSRIQPVVVVFQPHFIKEIERCGQKIQQYHNSICNAIDIASKVQTAWQNFFTELKRQFNGDENVVSAEAVALRLTEHYFMKIASEGGGLHVPAETISAEYEAFVEQLERLARIVAQYDYAGKREEQGRVEMRTTNDTSIVQIKGCGNVQVLNDNSRVVQFSGSVSKNSKTTWLWSIVGTVIAAIITFFLKWLLGEGG